ncbi:caveolin-3-like [Agrilus planipennis]|uniref:Caveolin n=1 Tax=Agrilus planipennis TaxID=224129 RepID=A0A7F5RCZ3_AGRPL|nr:caveolin-3-like [Agrilus planipennis]
MIHAKTNKRIQEMAQNEDRDPNDLNRHLEVSWEDVIGEPEGVHSPEFIWKISNQCFRISKGCSYILLTAIFAPLTAFCFGFTFACLAFKHIWCTAPCLRVWKITCTATRSFVTPCMEAITVPFCESIGTFWSQIKIRKQNLLPDISRKDEVIPI